MISVPTPPLDLGTQASCFRRFRSGVKSFHLSQVATGDLLAWYAITRWNRYCEPMALSLLFAAYLIS